MGLCNGQTNGSKSTEIKIADRLKRNHRQTDIEWKYDIGWLQRKVKSALRQEVMCMLRKVDF